ncbi:hypothetical protein ABR772_25465 [Bacillus cereus]|uniref:hypothetical protein n=1 Tax=Bacillus cereus TaxID=1396 RepID=UPI0035572EE4
MTNNRISQQDILAKDKLEASTYLLYCKKYRDNLSNDAKLMYQYLLKRFSITQVNFEKAVENDKVEEFNFVDDEGDIYCYASNDELRFVLNLSENTVKKCKKELHAVDLMDEVKQTTRLTNRIYLKHVVMDLEDKKQFKIDLDSFKEEEAKKRKEKNDKRKQPKTKKAAVKKTKAPKLPPVEMPSAIEEMPVITGVKAAKKLNRKNYGSLNSKYYGSLNRKNCGHSTKELKSTKEKVISTKELNNQSINNSVNNIDSVLNELDMPMYIIKRISMNKDRLISDNINPLSIESFYNSKEHNLDDHTFALVIERVLKTTKDTISNIHAVLRTACKNEIKEAQEAVEIEVEDDTPVFTGGFNPTNPILRYNPFN